MFEVGRRQVDKCEVRGARLRHVAIGMMLLLLPTIMKSQVPDSVLQQMTRMALERHPEIRAMAASVRAAEQRAARVGVLDDPDVMVQWFANPARAGGVRNAAFGVRQRMPWPGSLAAERDGATAGARARSHALDVARVQLTLAVANTWHARHAQARLIDLTSEHISWLARLEALARQRHELGLLSQTELLRIEIEREQLLSDQRLMWLEAAAIEVRLRALVQATNADSLPIPNGPQIVIPYPFASLTGSHPMLQEADAMIREAESMARRARLEGRPMVDIGVEVMGPEFSMMESSFAWPIVPSVSFTLPIWRSKTKAIRQEADALVQEAGARYEATLSTLSAERAEAELMLQQADESVALYRDRMLPRSTQLTELILLEYSTGKRMADEVIMARRMTLDLSMKLEEAIRDRNSALARLQSLYPTLEF